MEFIEYIAIATSSLVFIGALIYAFAVRKKEVEMYNRETAFVGKLGTVKQESEQLHQKSQHLIDHARETAQRILEDAMTRSGSIIKQADTFQQEMQQESRSTFLEASYEYSQKFEAELKDMIVNYKKLFEDSEKVSLEAAIKVLDEQKVLSAQLLRQHVDNQVKAVDEELAQFKVQEQQRIAQRANTAVVAIVKNVVGSSFTAADHEELIKNSLEQAKQEGLFNL